MIWSSRTVFQKAFKSVFGFSNTATNTEIDAYYGKDLTGNQAALLFHAIPSIPATDLKTDGTIEYNGKSYDMKKPDSIADLIAAKNASTVLNKENFPEISVAFCKDCSGWINKEDLIHFCENKFDLKKSSREESREKSESSEDEIETISLKELENYQLKQIYQIENK